MKVCGQVILTVHGRERILKVADVPTEGKCFEVNPQAIDQSLFQKKREHDKQERTRKLIMEALDKVKSNPEKYGKKFKTFMPKNTWESKTVVGIKQLACELGDHNADWVEQALEWAQRICNGEAWEAVCNNADTANWFRLVVWKNGNMRLVGGSRFYYPNFPASDVGSNDCYFFDAISYAVPLVVLYEK